MTPMKQRIAWSWVSTQCSLMFMCFEMFDWKCFKPNLFCETFDSPQTWKNSFERFWSGSRAQTNHNSIHLQLVETLQNELQLIHRLTYVKQLSEIKAFSWYFLQFKDQRNQKFHQQTTKQIANIFIKSFGFIWQHLQAAHYQTKQFYRWLTRTC